MIKRCSHDSTDHACTQDAATAAISASGGMGLRRAVGAMRERALREQLAEQGVTDPMQLQHALELDSLARVSVHAVRIQCACSVRVE